MNPGVQANIIAIVVLILICFSWGTRTLQDGHLTPRAAGALLIGYVMGSGWTLSAPNGLHWDLSGVMLPVVLTLWVMISARTWAIRFQWVMGILTVASVLVVLMTLVPLDPAFFPLGSEELYPLAAALVTVFSMRRPFAALTVAIVGVAFSTLLVPLLHGATELQSIVIEGGEVRDMIAYTAAVVMVLHRPYHLCVRYLVGMMRHLFGRQEGGPEHV